MSSKLHCIALLSNSWAENGNVAPYGKLGIAGCVPVHGSSGQETSSSPGLATPVAFVSFPTAASLPQAQKPAVAALENSPPPEADKQRIRRVLFCCRLPLARSMGKIKTDT